MSLLRSMILAISGVKAKCDMLFGRNALDALCVW